MIRTHVNSTIQKNVIMNNIRNSITLIGHLGQDPQINTTQTGKKVANMSIATNDSYRNDNGDKVTTTEWHRCVAWGKLAELAGSMCKKGKEVAIRGKLTYRKYEDKEGVSRIVPEIILSEFVLVGKPA
jgi:single-strand DNA-binding protein